MRTVFRPLSKRTQPNNRHHYPVCQTYAGHLYLESPNYRSQIYDCSVATAFTTCQLRMVWSPSSTEVLPIAKTNLSSLSPNGLVSFFLAQLLLAFNRTDSLPQS